MAGTKTITLPACIDFSSAAVKRDEIGYVLLQSGLIDIELDMKNVEYCDSAGVALLIDIKRHAKREKKVVRIINVPENVLAMAEFFSVDKLLAV